MKRGWFIAGAVVAVLLLSSLAYVLVRYQERRTFNGRIADAVRGGSVVDLRRTIEGSWDHLHVFDCYTSPEEVNRALGFPYRDGNVDDVGLSEGHSLLLFVAGQKVVFSVLHPRNEGDFYPHAVGQSFQPADVVFTVETSTGDHAWKILRPLHSAPAESGELRQGVRGEGTELYASSNGTR